MKNKKCSRKRFLKNEFIHDWDELNISFKSLIIVAVILLLVVISIAIFSDGGKGVQNSLEVVFRSTLASVVGFLLSSNIKLNSRKKNEQIEKIKAELSELQASIEDLDESVENTNDKCILEESYTYKEINIVQISIALGICITSISILGVLLITNNLENVQAVSQIRDLMCSSIGFLIGESGKK
ncbi:MAG: hypothetical protein RR712_03070 [Terrisporobacter sp.]|uniref:hypothetical protein n=1 Tax=Terrisporobacter sp. TaxID=1965305 RepID=UPI002FCC36CA